MNSIRFVAVLTSINLGLAAFQLVGARPTNPTDKAAPSVVRAQAIELVDGEGNARAQLYLGADGGGNLRLRSGKGEIRVKLDATEEGAGLLFTNRNTEPAVLLSSKNDGPKLTLTGLDKKAKLVLP